MKYYGERTQKLYDTEKECMAAEFKAKEQENLARIAKEKAEREEKEKKEAAAAQRKTAAEKVENARKAMVEAQEAYRKELADFCKDFGPYHFSINGIDGIPQLLNFISDWI